MAGAQQAAREEVSGPQAAVVWARLRDPRSGRLLSGGAILPQLPSSAFTQAAS